MAAGYVATGKQITATLGFVCRGRYCLRALGLRRDCDFLEREPVLLMALSKQQKEIFNYVGQVFAYCSLVFFAPLADMPMPYFAAYFAVLTVVAVPQRYSEAAYQRFSGGAQREGRGSLLSLLMAMSKQQKEVFDYLVGVLVCCWMVYFLLDADLPYFAACFAVLMVVGLVSRKLAQRLRITNR